MAIVDQLWDLIENCSFGEEVKDIENDENKNDEENNNDKGVSALGLDRNL